jgi:PBSX family phage terminase large subunit
MSFSPTEKQKQALKLLGTDATDICLYGGSRSGKTTLLTYAVVVRALKEPNSRHAIFRYHLTDIHTSVYLDTFPKVLAMISLDLRAQCRESKDKSALYTTLPNGSEIWFAGLDTAERAEKVLGREFSTAYFNEVSQLPYSSVLKAKTRLAQKNNLAKKSYYDENPAGTGHWSYKMFIEKVSPSTGKALETPQNYASMLLNPSDNLDNIDPQFLSLLEQFPDDERNRFLYGIFNSGIDGAIYNREFGQAEQEKRLGIFPHNPQFPVYTGWDIGVADKTAIWFAQFVEDWIYIVDYYENQFQSIQHYAEILKAKPYRYGLHFFPSDMSNRSWSTGKSRRETAIDLGIEPRIMPNLGHDDRINAVKEIFKRCHFDKNNCSAGLECLRNYRFEMNEKNGVYGQKPVHDWASDGATAFEPLALGYKELLGRPTPPIIKRTNAFIFDDLLEESSKNL